jgi:hypothetical protein
LPNKSKAAVQGLFLISRAVAMAALLLFALPAASQTDSTRLTLPADTSRTLLTQDPSGQELPEGKKSYWAAGLAIGAILITSYLLYNVRSR